MTIPVAETCAIVPFGKYKGQPIAAVLQDRGYFEWLTAQDWFRERYQSLFTIIVNNFGQPSETPEHNVLQSRFLDETYREKVANLLSNGRNWETYAEMEVDGFDVRLDWSQELQRPRRDRKDWWIAYFLEIKPSLGDDYPAVLRQMTTAPAFVHKDRYAIKDYHDNDFADVVYFALVVGDYSGAISESQLKSYFDSRNIKVIFTDEIDTHVMLELSDGKE